LIKPLKGKEEGRVIAEPKEPIRIIKNKLKEKREK